MRRVSPEAIFGPALLLVAGRGVALAITFVVPLVLARILIPADFGTYRQLLLLFTTLYTAAQLGMAESLFYFIPSQPRHAGRHVANALFVLGVVGTLAFLLLSTLAAPLAAWLGNPVFQPLAALLGAYLALMLLAAPLEIAMVSRKMHAAASATDALSDIARAALTLLPALLIGSVEALLIGVVAFAALRAGATLVYCWKAFGVDFRPDAPRAGRQLAYALPLHLAAVLEIAQGNAHAYVIAARFDAAAFAVYSIGCLQLPLVDLIASSACNVMMVRMRERAATQNAAAIMPLWRETTAKLALALVPLLGMLAVVAGDLLVVLFTDAYAASVPVFRAWICLTLFAALPVHGALRVLGDTRFVAMQTAIKLAVVVALIHGFLSVFGMTGGVMVSLLAMLVGKTILLVRLQRLTAVTVSELLPWRSYAVIAIAAAAAAWPAVTVRALGGSSLERLLFAGVTYVVAYGLLASWLGLLPFSVAAGVGGLVRRLHGRGSAPRQREYERTDPERSARRT
jgi:O-antigen/teichoic acid export membrane protein